MQPFFPNDRLDFSCSFDEHELPSDMEYDDFFFSDHQHEGFNEHIVHKGEYVDPLDRDLYSLPSRQGAATLGVAKEQFMRYKR